MWTRRVRIVVFLLGVSAAASAERPPRVLVPRHAKRPAGTMPVGESRLGVSMPDGHRVLAQDLRDRGLSGRYLQLVFHDERDGSIRTYAASTVKNFWHANGRWHYRFGVLEHHADRLEVVTAEAVRLEISPRTKGYRVRPSVFVSPSS